MKKLIFILSLISTQVLGMQKDTTIVEFVDANKSIKVISSTGESFSYPKILNLNSVLKNFDIDSTQRERAWVFISKRDNANDTLFIANRSGNSFSIVFKDLDALTQSNSSDEIRSFEPEKTSEPDIKRHRNQRKSRYFKNYNFDLFLGLNSYTNQSASGLAELRPWQSRYVSMGVKKNSTLSNGENLHLALTYGPEIAWHNFMLENSKFLNFENSQASFMDYSSKTKKSKFVVPHLNFPVMMNFGFKKEKFKIGLGGYVGYRLDAYTKVKFAETRGKLRERNGSLGLENVKYGLTAELGNKAGMAFFFRYDLNNLFKENQVNIPDTQAFSFGIKL